MKDSSHRTRDIAIKPASAVTLAVGFWQGYKKYDQDTERAFRRPLCEKQLQYYFEVSDVGSRVVTLDDSTEKMTATKKFWQLYYGPMIVIEDDGVEQVMINFGNCLGGTTLCDSIVIWNRSFALSTRIPESIGRSWSLNLDEPRGKYR